MTPQLAPAVGTGHIQTKSDQYCLYSKLTDDRVEWCTCQSWTWYGYLPARGLSQYARDVRKIVRMRRLVAIILPRTYIKLIAGASWGVQYRLRVFTPTREDYSIL